MRRMLIAALALTLSPPGAAASDRPLDPDRAFQLSVRAVDSSTVEVGWQIAEGCYLYRDKIRLSADSHVAHLGMPSFSPAQLHEDAFLGRTLIYRKSAKVIVPVSTDTRGGPIELRVDFQGCDGRLGICYQPMSRKRFVRLPR